MKNPVVMYFRHVAKNEITSIFEEQGMSSEEAFSYLRMLLKLQSEVMVQIEFQYDNLIDSSTGKICFAKFKEMNLAEAMDFLEENILIEKSARRFGKMFQQRLRKKK